MPFHCRKLEIWQMFGSCDFCRSFLWQMEPGLVRLIADLAVDFIEGKGGGRTRQVMLATDKACDFM